MIYDEWTIYALKKKGITLNLEDNSLDIRFFKNKVTHVPDLDTAIRQQQHIIDQQRREQKENEEIGILMKKFHETVLDMTKMNFSNMPVEDRVKYKNSLMIILEVMSKKREDLRRDGYSRLQKVMKMIEDKNLPAANLASQAALDRMRKRWIVNRTVIDKSLLRLDTLSSLKK